MNKDELRKLVTETLEKIKLPSLAGVNLVLGTIAQESANGKYTRQLGGGPALGICQMEPATEKDIWINFLVYKDGLAGLIEACTGVSGPSTHNLEHNKQYQVAMCRVHYYRVKEQLPAADDIEGMAKYWKKYYNTEKGKGTVEEFVENYKKYVA